MVDKHGLRIIDDNDARYGKTFKHIRIDLIDKGIVVPKLKVNRYPTLKSALERKGI